MIENTPQIHHLKIHPEPFAQVKSGAKPYEIRLNDRDFAVGDVLILDEYEPVSGLLVGEYVTRRISCITPGGNWGLPENLCVLGLLAEDDLETPFDEPTYFGEDGEWIVLSRHCPADKAVAEFVKNENETYGISSIHLNPEHLCTALVIEYLRQGETEIEYFLNLGQQKWPVARADIRAVYPVWVVETEDFEGHEGDGK